MFTLTIRSRPADIPSHFELDVTEVVIGSSLRVADIAMPEGVATDVDPESAIVIGQPPRVVVEEAPEGEAAEGEAPEGEAAEGEAAEGGAASAEGGGESGGES